MALPLRLTALQAAKNHLCGRHFDLKRTQECGNTTKQNEIRKIWMKDGLIKAQIYWSQYGWINETLHPDSIIDVLKKCHEVKEAVNSIEPPSESSITPFPKTTSHLFSQDLTPHKISQEAKPIDLNEAIAAIVVYESLIGLVMGRRITNFSKSVQTFLDNNGICALREHCIPIARMIEKAYLIANADREERCSHMAWDLEFIPEFVAIILDDKLQIKSNWRQISNAYGAYVSSHTTLKPTRDAILIQ